MCTCTHSQHSPGAGKAQPLATSLELHFSYLPDSNWAISCPTPPLPLYIGHPCCLHLTATTADVPTLPGCTSFTRTHKPLMDQAFLTVDPPAPTDPANLLTISLSKDLLDATSPYSPPSQIIQLQLPVPLLESRKCLPAQDQAA